MFVKIVSGVTGNDRMMETKRYVITRHDDGVIKSIVVDPDETTNIEFMLTEEDQAFIMNDEGKTIDSIYVYRKKKPFKRHDDDCNVWVGVQQCDGPDLTRPCSCQQIKRS